MLALCKNGHVTGYRKCGTCGADRTTEAIGLGKVVTPKHLLDKQSEFHKLRNSTKLGTGCQGPNKINNINY